jgi:hypothetical protein
MTVRLHGNTIVTNDTLVQEFNIGMESLASLHDAKERDDFFLKVLEEVEQEILLGQDKETMQYSEADIKQLIFEPVRKLSSEQLSAVEVPPKPFYRVFWISITRQLLRREIQRFKGLRI